MQAKFGLVWVHLPVPSFLNQVFKSQKKSNDEFFRQPDILDHGLSKDQINHVKKNIVVTT